MFHVHCKTFFAEDPLCYVLLNSPHNCSSKLNALVKTHINKKKKNPDSTDIPFVSLPIVFFVF